MNLYIKTEEGYSIEQRSEYSKIKCYLKEKQINNEEFYKKYNIEEKDIKDLLTNTEINNDIMDKFEKMNIEEIVLPNNIQMLNEYQFSGMTTLKKIELPKKLEKISGYCFYDCKNLEKIKIPENVTKISECTFEYCSNLKKIVLPESVTTIGNSAFSFCSNLEEIEIPNSVTKINNYAFIFCEKLKKINIPDNITTIGEDIFYKCNSLKEIKFADVSYKEKPGLQEFIKQYENKITVQSLDEIIENKDSKNKTIIEKEDIER